MAKRTPKTFRYTFRVEFRKGGSREEFSTTTSEREARRDVWCGLESMGLNPQVTVRRIDLVSKTPAQLTGLEAL